MIGFLHAGALVGLVAVAVPILIHLLKMNRRKQVVPSLLLFTSLKKTSRRYRIRNWIVLLLRILAVSFLIFLLARPYLRMSMWSASLKSQAPLSLGIVIDDGLSSYLAVAGETLLRRSIRKATRLLKTLSDKDLVVIGFTSDGACSRPMTPRQAVAMLNGARSVPVNTNLRDVMENIWRTLRKDKNGKHCGLVIFAPLTRDLWKDVGVGGEMPRARYVNIDALTNTPVDAFIQNVFEEGNDELCAVRVHGEPFQLNDAFLNVMDSSGTRVSESRLDLDMAIRKTVSISNANFKPGKGVDFELEPIAVGKGGELRRFYWVPEIERERKRILIIYDDTPVSTLYAQIAYVALRSTEDSDSRIDFIDISSDSVRNEKALNNDALVLCPLKDYSRLTKNVTRRVADGERVVVFPPAASVGEFTIFDGDKIEFRPDIVFNSPQKLSVAMGISDDGKRMMSLADKGLAIARIEKIHPPKTNANDQILLFCDQRPVVVKRLGMKGKEIVLFGVGLERGAMDLLTNPVFPQLLKELVLGRQEKYNLTKYVDEIVNAGEWLGIDQGSFLCRFPNGSESVLSWGKEKPFDLFLSEAGIYRFARISQNQIARNATGDLEIKAGADGKLAKQEEASVFYERAVNLPRPDLDMIPKSEVIEAFEDEHVFLRGGDGDLRTHPIAGDADLSAENVVEAGDISPFVGMFLWMVVMLEMVLSTYSANRGRVMK